MSGYDELISDLRTESDALDACVDPLTVDELHRPTPADGWTIADQLAHLAGFDEAALLAIQDPEAFSEDVQRRIAEGDDPIAGYTARGRNLDPLDVVAWWKRARSALIAAAPQAEGRRVPWYGPPMSAMSFLTARLMETWAHGQDVRDALGIAPEQSARLRHVAHIGVGARGYSFTVRGLDVPSAEIDVRLSGPTGEQWTWGSGDAVQYVEGPAVDFCLLVTQRRHRDDCALHVVGDDADRWMDIAQAFAGGPGPGRPKADRGD